MKHLLAFLLITSVFVSCTDKKQKEEAKEVEVEVVEEAVIETATDSLTIETTTESETVELSKTVFPETVEQ